MNWHTEFEQTIQSQFESLKERSKSYSLRAFAQKLKISHTSLSDILKGSKNWKLSPERAAELLEKMNISENKKAGLLALMGMPSSRKEELIPTEDYRILLDVTYAAVLTCHDLPVADRTPEKISARLGLVLKDVNLIITDLLCRGYLQRQDDGTLSTHSGIFRAGGGPPNAVVRGHHRNNMHLAAQMVELIPSTERHYESLTFAGSLEQLDLVRQEVKIFQQRIMNLMKINENQSEIFRISVSLFPLKNLNEVKLP